MRNAEGCNTSDKRDCSNPAPSTTARSLVEGGVGRQSTIRTPQKANTAVPQNTICKPPRVAKAGPSTKARAKAIAILAPITALAFARCDGRVKSAASAIVADAIAPLPCKKRPRIMPAIVDAVAATALPSTSINKPPATTQRRSTRSDSQPIGICRQAWVNP